MTRLPTRPQLTIGEVAEIKQELWDGVASQGDIAKAYSISQTTVSRICRGEQWGQVPWNDGSTGELPNARVAEIFRERSLIIGSSNKTALPPETVVQAAAKVAEREAEAAEAKDAEFAEQIKMKPKNRR